MKIKLLFSFALIACLIACQKGIDYPNVVGPAAITRFVFTKADNPSLAQDLEGSIVGNEIKIRVGYLSNKNLKPTIYHTGRSISNDQQVKDFSNPVIYDLTDHDGRMIPYVVKIETRDVYIAATEQDANGLFSAVYWKNGSKQTIALDGAIETSAAGIGITNNKLIVAGTSYFGNLTNRAVYWENGVRKELTDGTSNSMVHDMTVVNNDVYIVGTINDKNGGTPHVVYWKNGVKTELTDGTAPIHNPSCIYVNNNDVYVSGHDLANRAIAVYWKNGTKNTLDDVVGIAGVIYAVATVGNDFYAFGRYQNAAVYWKNGARTRMPYPEYVAKGITNNTDVYMVGYQNPGTELWKGVYWKNGIKTILSDGTTDVLATRIAVKGDDIYIAGKETLNGINQPIYWINGVATRIANAKSCEIRGLFVSDL